MRTFVIVPTLNAAKDWPRFAPPLLASFPPQQVLIIDSSSTDGTESLAREAGFRFHRIPRHEFDHGATRQLGAEMLPEADILVYLTQDAVLVGSDSLPMLVGAFEDASVVAAYGRQLPRQGATPIEAHARCFNYPSQSNVRTPQNRYQSGFRAVFLSNSFAAYRRSALMRVGGFPKDVIFGEDTITAGRLILAGGSIAYVAEAKVQHSHDYTWSQEFRRYFDIGVMHSREGWLLREFGRTGGEGKRFVLSELKYLLKSSPWLIPSAVIRTMLKLAAYRLGTTEQRLRAPLKANLSMHRNFWTADNR